MAKQKKLMKAAELIRAVGKDMYQDIVKLLTEPGYEKLSAEDLNAMESEAARVYGLAISVQQVSWRLGLPTKTEKMKIRPAKSKKEK
jgi:hypothetical protein